MNKLVFDDPGGYPFNEISINHIQDAWLKGFEGIGKALTPDLKKGVILDGCEVTLLGDDLTTTAGLIYLVTNSGVGEVFVVDGNTDTNASGNHQYWKIVETYIGSDPTTFEDATTHDVHLVRKVEINYTNGVPIDVGTIHFAVSTVPTIDNAIRLLINPDNDDFVAVSTFINNWSDGGTVKYLKERTANGLYFRVTIIGEITRTGTPVDGETICSGLPAPAADTVFALDNGLGTTGDFNGIKITTGGLMKFKKLTAITTTAYMYLNGQVSYYVAV